MIKTFITSNILVILTLSSSISSSRLSILKSDFDIPTFARAPSFTTRKTLSNNPQISKRIKPQQFRVCIPQVNTAASRIGLISSPSLNFDFSANKLSQASSIFNTRKIDTKVSSTKNYSNSTFSGFSSAYKSQMAYLIAGIRDLNSSEGRLLSDKLTMDLISIDNTLKLISMNKSRQLERKPILQFQVKQFLTDLDTVRARLSRQKSPIVIGNSNIVKGMTTQVQGNGNTVIGNSNVVTGDGNSLIGNQSLVSGSNNGITGNKGITIGLNNSIKADNSYVFGSHSTVTKNNSLIVGNNTIDLEKLQSGGGKYLVKNNKNQRNQRNQRNK